MSSLVLSDSLEGGGHLELTICTFCLQAWRLLTRSFLPASERGNVLAYSPMLHARLFADSEKYRDSHFQPTRATMSPAHVAAFGPSDTESNKTKPYLDGNPAIDRPLFVQFCANDPQALLAAAKLVAPYCDAVDLNFGCPQGIARKGHYGAFLQEDQELIHNLVKILHDNLSIPVTAKIRILDTKEATLAYAKNVLSAGASILTVHGRRRHQKGHLTGVADWGYIRYLRENLPPETVIFANGNILQHGDLQKCLDATGADGVMSAEGNLSDPALFAPPPLTATDEQKREYWRGKDGRGGYRVDAIMRRYLDIMHKYVLEEEPPARRPLFVPGDDESWLKQDQAQDDETEEPARKKRRKEGTDGKAIKATSVTVGPNFVAMQAHLFHLLRHFVTKHTIVRDALARSRLGDISVYEKILDMVERKTAEGLLEYEKTDGKSFEEGDGARNGAYEKGVRGEGVTVETEKDGNSAVRERDDESTAKVAGEQEELNDPDSSVATVRRCKRPWWVAQPIVRPLPKEALAKGAISLSKKDKLKLAEAAEQLKNKGEAVVDATVPFAKEVNGDNDPSRGDAAGQLEDKTEFTKTDLVSG